MYEDARSYEVGVGILSCKGACIVLSGESVRFKIKKQLLGEWRLKEISMHAMRRGKPRQFWQGFLSLTCGRKCRVLIGGLSAYPIESETRSFRGVDEVIESKRVGADPFFFGFVAAAEGRIIAGYSVL